MRDSTSDIEGTSTCPPADPIKIIPPAIDGTSSEPVFVVEPPWVALPDAARLIAEGATLPWVPLTLGTELTPGANTIAEVRAGAIVAVMGPTGAGKSSFTGGLLLAHAQRHGPVLACSLELPADEFSARIAGMQLNASWGDVLRGRVPNRDVERVLDVSAFKILDRRNATLDTLEIGLRYQRRQHPDDPILAAVDYVQITESGDGDARAKVTETMRRIDDIAREHKAVIIAVNQMSRANSRAAKTGEILGAETTDSGAESACIERYASLTLTLGAMSEPAEDGSRAVSLSIGKARMGEGDRVIPMRFEGRSGRWRITGEARVASEVRAELEATRESNKLTAASLAIVAAAEKSKSPLSRSELAEQSGVRKALVLTAVTKLLAIGELVEVQRKRPRSSACLVWTPARAAEAGIPIVDPEARDGE